MKNGIVLLGLLVCSSGANILNVPGEYATIGEGINAAADGDTVLVVPGEYYEGIDFSGKKITVTSNFMFSQDSSDIQKTIIRERLVPPDSCMIFSQPRKSVVFDSSEDARSVLCGFMILDETVNITNRSNPKLKSLWIYGTKYPDFVSCRFSSLSVGGAGEFVVSGVTLNNSWLYVSGANRRITVRGSVLKNSSYSQYLSNGMGIVDSNTFINSVISIGATSTYSDSIAVINNTFIDGRISMGGTGEARHYGLIENNVFKKDTASYSGITLSGTGDNRVTVEIRKNNFYGSTIRIGGTGAYVVNADISRNIFTDAANAAIQFSPISVSTYSCEFAHNTVVGNKYGIFVYDTVGTLNIVNCIIWGNGTDLMKVSGAHISYSLWGTGLDVFENGNLTGDPMLIDTANNDFRLRNGSPCIDKGDPASPADPDSSRPDIGAIPFGTMVNQKKLNTAQSLLSRTGVTCIKGILHFSGYNKNGSASKVTAFTIRGTVLCKLTVSNRERSIDLNRVIATPGLYLIHIERNQASMLVSYLKKT